MLACCAGLGLAGCGALPPRGEAAPTSALAPAPTSPLVRIAQASLPEPGLSGFRLLPPMIAANAVTLGTLAAIRAQGQSVWSLGIVRRIRRITSDRGEIGLQIIANALVGVDLVEQRRTTESDYSVDGEPTMPR